MDATGKVDEIAKRIKELGQTSFALTEHGTISSWFDGYKNAKKQGLKYIFGIEAYFTPEVTIKDREKTYHLCLYAMNDEGLYNIKQLVAMSNALGFYYDPRVDIDMLKQYSSGILATSACMGGILKSEYPHGYTQTFKQLFNGNFYLAIHTNSTPAQREFNKKAIEISKLCGVGLIAEVDSHYIHKKDADSHRKWMGLKGSGEYYNTDDYYLMSEKEVREALSYLPKEAVDEAINNTQVVVDKCNVEIDYNQKNFPVFPVDDQLSYLKNLALQGYQERILPYVPTCELETYQARMVYEFEVLEKCNYLNYFCITHDITNYCRTNGIRLSPGRGSVAGSLVAFLLGITSIDPIKYGLVFERFCNPERVTMPDIDLDFPQRYRQQVIEFIKNKYGNVFQVRTFNAMKDKGAVQRAGQSLGIDPQVIDKLSKNITTLKDLINVTDNMELIQLSHKFLGIIQNFGVHASAVVVLPKHPAHFTGIEKQGDNFVVCHDYHDLEQIGILKQDILGLKTLDVVDNCINSLDDYIDLEQIPLDDAKTFDMLCRGETDGVFQIEGEGMTKLVVDLQPRRYEDLIPLIALYRPGTLNAGMVDVFVRRRKGEEAVTYPHPSLEPILKETYGVILYQEQTMQIARSVSGYSLGEADVLRRAIGRKELDTMQSLESDFINRATIPQANEIWDKIKTFAEYGFNKSHSAAYSMLSYHTAYLKANYPLNFFCALFNSEQGNLEKTAEHVEQAIKAGINILPPHVIYSKNEWTIEDGSLRVGLSSIKDVGSINISGKFSTIEEFIELNGSINKQKLIALACVDAFPGHMAYNIDYVHWFKSNQKKIEDAKSKLVVYASNPKKLLEWQAKLKNIQGSKPHKSHYNGIPYDERTMVQHDLDYLGFTLRNMFTGYDVRMHNGVNIFACQILEQKIIKDKNGKTMSFIVAKDIKGKRHNFVMFAHKHRQLSKNEVYILKVNGTQIIESMLAKTLLGQPMDSLPLCPPTLKGPNKSPTANLKLNQGAVAYTPF